MAYQYPLNGGRLNASINPSGNTAGVPGLISTGTLHIAGGNNITLSQNGASVTISGAANAGGVGLSAGTQSASTGTINFANSNGVTFGMSASNQITASVATDYAASNHSHGNPSLNLTNLSGSTASASNGLTLSLSAPAQSNLSATGAVSLSSNGNTISIGAPAFSAGIATNSTVSNQIIFSAGNNITLSQSTNPSGATIAIHGTSGGGGGGIALANSQATYTSGTAQLLEGAGAITIGSGTGQRFNISVPQASSMSVTGALSIMTTGNTISMGAPAMSVLSAGNGISISTTGSTVVFQAAGGGAAKTFSYFNPQDAYALAAGQHGQGTVHIQPGQLPNVQFDRVAMPMVISNATNSSGSQTASFHFGIYTRTASTLSLMSSVSTSFAVTQSGTAGSYSLFGGQRLLTMGFTGTLLEDQYYFGIMSRTSSGGANASMSQLVASQISSNFSGIVGQASNATDQQTRGLGYFSASSSALPVSIAFTQIRGTGAMALRQPSFYLVSQTF